MILVDDAHVGRGAYARMVADRVVVPLGARRARPADVPSSLSLRALSLAHVVPTRAALSGLAALWVHGWAPGTTAPRHVEVVVTRGAHPDAPPSSDALGWRLVTDTVAWQRAVPAGGIRVAAADDAAAAALLRAPLALALPAAAWALREAGASVPGIDAALERAGRAASATRARSALSALQEALGRPEPR